MPRNPPTFLTLPVELRLEIYTHLLVLPPPPPRETLQATYRCSYAASPLSSSPTKTNPKPTLHPEILRVNSQVYHEALPVLYSQNTFSAHPVRLTAQPRLYHPYCTPCRPIATLLGTNFAPTTIPNQKAPLSTTNPNTHLIRKWHLRLRLDATPATNPAAASEPSTNNNIINGDSDTTMSARLGASFSHADALTLELWRGMPATRTRTPAPTPNTNTNTNSDADADPAASADDDIGVETLRPFEHVRGVRRVQIVGATAGLEAYVARLRGRMMTAAAVGNGREGSNASIAIYL
ncbi:uncharacterized protein B0H64DRAFT_454843 [Chaetomium fimeti]|uniref:2EXR domain-containing protein n=1 Tax=Chaetomium fimeti TaxID=1854472 RepID=A0AAE0HM94_9PEZI|nr:hypothetical protein B0H64DRAFT_454843 [Chaetomium fimeti]